MRRSFWKEISIEKRTVGYFFDGISFEEFKSPEEIDEQQYPKIRDIKDLPVLASAILSDSDILITGDKDFEDVKIDKPLIFTPTKYFDMIEEIT